jgi:type I restriction enzyme M protein
MKAHRNGHAFHEWLGTGAIHSRNETWHPETNPEERWRRFAVKELLERDKASLDVFWIRDRSLTDLNNLPEPDELAEDIIEDLEAGLASFKDVLAAI